MSSDDPQIRTLEALLSVAEVDLGQWAVSGWEVKNGANDRWMIKALLKTLPNIKIDFQSVPNLRINTRKTPKSVLILPDVQFGFRWSEDRQQLEPLHDLQALALAVEIAKRSQPDVIVQLGDLLDLSPWSVKYVPDPRMRATTQASLQAAHDWLAELRSVCPSAPIHIVEGNHEARIQKALDSLMPEASGLRPVGSQHPALSLQSLMGLDLIGVEYHPGYPSAELWPLGDSTRIIHGTVVRRGGGATVAAIVRSASETTICGHIHRLELAGRTTHGAHGQKTVWAISPGTLSRIDGVVPGSASPDWQQGCLLLHGSGHPELIPFLGATAMYRGEMISCS